MPDSDSSPIRALEHELSRHADPGSGPGPRLLADLLRCGHPVMVTARGNSMLPAIEDGAQVRITPLAGARPRRGDIVYIQRTDESYALHRVLRLFADGRLQTGGDAHWRLDDAVEPQAVLGQMQSPGRSHCARLRALLAWFQCWGRLARSWRGYRRERKNTGCRQS